MGQGISLYKCFTEAYPANDKRNCAVENNVNYFPGFFFVLLLKCLQFSKLSGGNAVQKQYAGTTYCTGDPKQQCFHFTLT